MLRKEKSILILNIISEKSIKKEEDLFSFFTI